MSKMKNYTYINVEASQQKDNQIPTKSLSKRVKARRKQIKAEAKEKLRRASFFNRTFKRAIKITGSGIDEWLNQPHKHYVEKNEMLLSIGEVIERADYLGKSQYKGRVTHIFETVLCGELTWIVVTDVPGRGATIHSISDSENILKEIIKPV